MNDPSQHIDGPALVFAGAGAGKTRALVERTKALVELGVDPHAIALVTFTNKAAEEMKGRIAHLLDLPTAEAVWTGTFHRFALQALQVYGEEIGLPYPSVLDASAQNRLAEQIINDLFPKGKPKGFTARAALGAVSRAVNSGWDDTQLVTMYADLTEKIAVFRWRYVDAKKAFGTLDYDDLLLQGIRLFKLSSGAAAMLRRRCLYVMVDEFQDTNTVQMELVQAIAPGHSPNLMVVGDPDQSIYGWRGADYRTILNFQRMYPEASVYHLSTNYRCQAAVVETANRVIAYNSERKPEMQVAHREMGEKPFVMVATSAAEEAHFVGRAIAYYNKLGIPYEHMAVLVRANYLTLEFEQNLRAAGIPYQFTGGLGFFERPEIQLILNLLKTLDNPTNPLGPSFLFEELVPGAGSQGVQKVVAVGKTLGLNPLEAFTDEESLKSLRGSTTREAARGLAEMVLGWRMRALSEPLSGLLAELQEAIPIQSWLEKNTDSEEMLFQRKKNLERFLQVIEAWEECNPQGSLGQLVSEIALEALSTDSSGKGVHLMTIHTSKGMEFQVVFTVGLAEGVFPLSRSLASRETLEEERRLFYVALTRAKDYLHLSYPQRNSFGGSSRPSIFLQESNLETRSYDPLLGYHGVASTDVLVALSGL